MENTNWAKLGFGYTKTNYNIRCYYKNGEWGEIEVSSQETITMHMAATSLHYGQELFEGLKAFRGKDGEIRVFRWKENAKRLQNSASGILMPELPVDIFEKALFKAIRLNKEFVPPYGSGASLYIRPLLIGTGAKVGVQPADEYLFIIFVTPVGPYFPEGFKPTDIMITRDFDRTAPLGTGRLKVGGNYAASLYAIREAQRAGYSTVLYLDAKEKKYIDECGPANFYGIKNNTYVTPDSISILPSITNNSLKVLAKAMGLEVECRKVPIDELAEFEEAGQCGTAAVITPIRKIVDIQLEKEYFYGNDPGPVSTDLYNKLICIQNGDEPDPYGWISFVD